MEAMVANIFGNSDFLSLAAPSRPLLLVLLSGNFSKSCPSTGETEEIFLSNFLGLCISDFCLLGDDLLAALALRVSAL